MARSSSRRLRRNTRKHRTLKRKTQTRRQRTRKPKTRRNVKRGGGFMTGALGAARQALLPFLAYTAQKSVQRRVKNKK